MNIAIASDHGGFELKSVLANALAEGYKILDKGPADKASCDYPDYAIAVAKSVASGEADFGILVCRSGIGMSMVANRFQNVRAAICATTDAATVTRQHNGANVLCLGADVVSPNYAVEIAKAFLSTPVDESERHARRRWKLERAERLSDCSGLMHDDPEVFAAIEAQTKQEDAEINLIASENTSSRACREAAGSVLMNKYAESGQALVLWLPSRRRGGGAREEARVRALRRGPRERAAALRQRGEHGRLLRDDQAGRHDHVHVARPGRAPLARLVRQLLRQDLQHRPLHGRPEDRDARLRRDGEAGDGGQAQDPSHRRVGVSAHDRLQAHPRDLRQGRLHHDGRHGAHRGARRRRGASLARPLRGLRYDDYAQDAWRAARRHGALQGEVGEGARLRRRSCSASG